MIVMQLKGCVKYNNNFRYIKFCVNGEVFWLKMTNDLGLTFLHFEFSSLYLDIFDQILIFCAKSFKFDQIYLNTGLKTQNVEKLSLDLIFHNNLW